MKRNILKTLVIAFSIVLVSLCVSCKKLELDKPTNIKYDGNTITWNSVDNAEYYKISINNGNEYETSSPQFAHHTAAGSQVSVSIVAVAKNKKKTVESDKASKMFTGLSSVKEIKVSDEGTLSWDPVDGATSYMLKIDSQETEVYDATYNALSAGTHTINIKPLVNGNDSYFSSYMTSSKTITICDKVDKDSIKYEYQEIKWNNAQGANYYEIKINGVVLETKITGTSYKYDSENNNFNVEIKAIGNHSTTFDGEWSENKKFVYLDTVTDIRVEDGKVKWQAVSGANAYKVRVNQQILSETFETPEYNKLVANQEITIEIMPISNDSTYFSDWSASKSIKILPAPILSWVNEQELDGTPMNCINWNQVQSATGYAVRVTLPNGTMEESTYGERQVYFSYDFLQVGDYTVEVKALSSTTNPNQYDSSYSTPIKVVRLAAPTPVTTNYIVSNKTSLSEGFVVTFNKVNGAFGYRLYKDNKNVQQSETNQFSVKDVSPSNILEEQTYNYKIQSMGMTERNNGIITATLSSLTADSLAFEIKVLATPLNPSISGYTYTFGSIDKATGYTVDIGGQSYVSNNTSYDLSSLTAGSFVVKACAQGNGSTILASNYSTPINVFRLNAPTNIRIESSESAEGILKYDGVQNAQGYEIVFNNDDKPINADTLTNVNQYISEQGTFVYMQSSANYFSDDNKIYYMTSPKGTTVNFIKLSTPTFGDVKFSNTQLMWKAPANINTSVYTPTYEVYYPGGQTYNGEKNGTTMDISYLEGGESYSFQVKAKGNGTNYIDSDKSTVVTIYKLSTPKVERKDGKYVWNGVPNAISYVIYIDGVEANKFTHVSGQTYEHAPLFNELKTYKVEVVAVGDNGYTSVDSKKCTITQEIKQLTTPDFTYEYDHETYVEEGNIIVKISKESSYASGYSYTIGDITKTSSEKTYSYCPNNVGKYDIIVYALGGSFDENGVYYIDSQSQGGNGKRMITLLSSPNPSSWKLTADGLLSWPGIDQAVKYEITIIANGGEEVVKQTTKTSIEIENYSMQNSYTVKIRVIGNGTTIISSLEETRDFYAN